MQSDAVNRGKIGNVDKVAIMIKTTIYDNGSIMIESELDESFKSHL
ncbi:MAG: hypothetical protein SR1Q5_01445 [Quinella sp. 1Q5]|nr:hypothetical protein [Quinella sp. 1Q5]